MICLGNSVNERDLGLLNSVKYDFLSDYFLQGHCVSNARKFEAITGSVMPLDVLGLHAQYTDAFNELKP